MKGIDYEIKEPKGSFREAKSCPVALRRGIWLLREVVAIISYRMFRRPENGFMERI